MKKFIQKNWIVLIAFILPVLLIGGVFLSVYLPSIFLAPQYDFVYVVCDQGVRVTYPRYSCEQYVEDNYVVENGKLVVKEMDPLRDLDYDGILDVNEGSGTYKVHLFVHNTDINESREISLMEAQLLTLDSSEFAPDKIHITRQYKASGDFIGIFGGRSMYENYLSKGDTHQEINITDSYNNLYYGNRGRELLLIGWVLPGRN